MAPAEEEGLGEGEGVVGAGREGGVGHVAVEEVRVRGAGGRDGGEAGVEDQLRRGRRRGRGRRAEVVQLRHARADGVQLPDEDQVLVAVPLLLLEKGRPHGTVAARRERWYRDTRLVATTDSSSSTFSFTPRLRPPPHGHRAPPPLEAEATPVLPIAGTTGLENVGGIWGEDCYCSEL